MNAMRMTDLIYLGLGAACLAGEKINARFRQLEKLKESMDDEVKKFIGEAEKRGLKEKEALKSRIREKAGEAVMELGLATKDDLREFKKELEETIKNKNA